MSIKIDNILYGEVNNPLSADNGLGWVLNNYANRLIVGSSLGTTAIFGMYNAASGVYPNRLLTAQNGVAYSFAFGSTNGTYIGTDASGNLAMKTLIPPINWQWGGTGGNVSLTPFTTTPSGIVTWTTSNYSATETSFTHVKTGTNWAANIISFDTTVTITGSDTRTFTYTAIVTSSDLTVMGGQMVIYNTGTAATAQTISITTSGVQQTGSFTLSPGTYQLRLRGTSLATGQTTTGRFGLILNSVA